MKYVKYAGYGTGYFLILKNKDQSPIAVQYVEPNQVIAVRDEDFQLLKEQGHIAKDRLQEVEPKSPYSPGSKPVTRVLDS